MTRTPLRSRTRNGTRSGRDWREASGSEMNSTEATLMRGSDELKVDSIDQKGKQPMKSSYNTAKPIDRKGKEPTKSSYSKLDPTDRKGKRQIESSSSDPDPIDRKGKRSDPIDRKGKEPTKSSYSKPDTIGRKGKVPTQSSYSKPDPTDRKGKRPSKSSNSKPEPHHNARVISSKTLCNICMEQRLTTQIFTIKSCNHLFCISCMVHYITSKLDENIAAIPCPDPGCKSGSLDPLIYQHILPVATFDKWGRVLCELSLGQKKFYCPFKDCSALLVDEGHEKVTNSECPHCNRMFCAECKVPWHGDISCEEFQGLGKHERAQEDLMLRKLAKDKKWQRCPQCRMYVEKIDGCMFMKCRCGYCFCYVCATPMSKETHYCTKCKR
ncbi:RING/U-box superfamily protein [Rhynchospora pubera]|uniref:RBR-type E3 ubiquitin transferase n=1 Tax=Rhynchospora pubera TaxID=906938 RepID=A0AAV8CZ22_9POAL|nr:RING/U-box superfamily protein [Rhynchospora pubera]